MCAKCIENASFLLIQLFFVLFFFFCMHQGSIGMCEILDSKVDVTSKYVFGFFFLALSSAARTFVRSQGKLFHMKSKYRRRVVYRIIGEKLMGNTSIPHPNNISNTYMFEYIASIPTNRTIESAYSSLP